MLQASKSDPHPPWTSLLGFIAPLDHSKSTLHATSVQIQCLSPKLVCGGQQASDSLISSPPCEYKKYTISDARNVANVTVHPCAFAICDSQTLFVC